MLYMITTFLLDYSRLHISLHSRATQIVFAFVCRQPNSDICHAHTSNSLSAIWFVVVVAAHPSFDSSPPEELPTTYEVHREPTPSPLIIPQVKIR